VFRCAGLSGPQLTSSSFSLQTDDITNDAAWSEPIYFNMLGIDQDVSRKH